MEFIYIIENIRNNKKYVGKTKSLIERKRSHFNKLKSNKHVNIFLQSSFNKYGIDSFIFYEIESCNDNIINEREIYWIEYFNTLNDNFGYNLTNGGNGGSPSEVIRKKQSEAHNIRKKKVYGFDSDGIFIKEWESIKECSRELCASPSDIRRTISGKFRMCKGIILQSSEIYVYRETLSEKVSKRERNIDGTWK